MSMLNIFSSNYFILTVNIDIRYAKITNRIPKKSFQNNNEKKE